MGLMFLFMMCSTVSSVVYSTIIYWSTGLNPQVDRFFIFLGILFLTTTNATALGYFVSSISPNAAIANAIGPPVFIILLLYGKTEDYPMVPL